MSKMGNELVNRLETHRCVRCGKARVDSIESNICGNCSDNLRAEEEAIAEQDKLIKEGVIKC